MEQMDSLVLPGEVELLDFLVVLALPVRLDPPEIPDLEVSNQHKASMQITKASAECSLSELSRIFTGFTAEEIY